MNAPDPCPRCGSACEAVRGPVPDRWGVRCLECGLWADDREATEAEAIAAWNRRALPARGVGVPTEAQFMDAVWAALKADATDLGKQQRILAAFRAALAPSAVDDSQTPNPAINAPDPIHRPTMTDMMVDPDTLDAFMEANPLPDEPSPTDAAHVNETPKSEHDGADVLTDAAQAREAALMEAHKAILAMDTKKDEDLTYNLAVLRAAEKVRRLIDEART